MEGKEERNNRVNIRIVQDAHSTQHTVHSTPHPAHRIVSSPLLSPLSSSRRTVIPIMECPRWVFVTPMIVPSASSTYHVVVYLGVYRVFRGVFRGVFGVYMMCT